MGLSVEHLTFGYGFIEILKDVSFHLEHGNLVCVLGKNGAGKSTLFRCILGLLKGYQGEILADGMHVRSLKERELAGKIAYIPQNHSTAFGFTVFDMVLMGTTSSISGLSSPGEEQRKSAMEALDIMNIQYLSQRCYSHISGGEQQLVLIARAIAQQARILIMDEPCANLDYGNQVRVMEGLKGLAEEGYLIIQSTHSPDQAFLYGDQALVLHEGKVAALGEPGVVLTQTLLEAMYDIPIRLMDVGNNGMKLCMPGGTR